MVQGVPSCNGDRMIVLGSSLEIIMEVLYSLAA